MTDPPGPAAPTETEAMLAAATGCAPSVTSSVDGLAASMMSATALAILEACSAL